MRDAGKTEPGRRTGASFRGGGAPVDRSVAKSDPAEARRSARTGPALAAPSDVFGLDEDWSRTRARSAKPRSPRGGTLGQALGFPAFARRALADAGPSAERFDELCRWARGGDERRVRHALPGLVLSLDATRRLLESFPAARTELHLCERGQVWERVLHHCLATPVERTGLESLLPVRHRHQHSLTLADTPPPAYFRELLAPDFVRLHRTLATGPSRCDKLDILATFPAEPCLSATQIRILLTELRLLDRVDGLRRLVLAWDGRGTSAELDSVMHTPERRAEAERLFRQAPSPEERAQLCEPEHAALLDALGREGSAVDLESALSPDAGRRFSAFQLRELLTRVTAAPDSSRLVEGLHTLWDGRGDPDSLADAAVRLMPDEREAFRARLQSVVQARSAPAVTAPSAGA